MHRRILSVSIALVIAAFLASVSLLTLAHAAPCPSVAAPASSLDPTEPMAERTVQGHVQTDDDPPLAVQDARILVKPAVGDAVLGQGMSDDAGAYTVTFDASGNCYRIFAETSDTISPTHAIPPSAWQVICFGFEDTKTVNFTYETPEARIVGRILISGTSSPPSFPVTVTARSRRSIDQPTVIRVSEAIGPDGFFTLTVPPATYDVLAIPADPCYSNPADLVLASGIEVSATHDLGAHYLSTVFESATLAGHVRTPAGDPVPGVDVRPIKIDVTDLENPAMTPWPLDTTNAEGSFSFCIPADLAEGNWWVGVALGSTDETMPYPMEWWTTVSLTATEVVTDIELLVQEANAIISGTLIQEQTGQPAVDACGVVAAYQQGNPKVYNARPFIGGTFRLPVITGTYRLAVIPDPGLPITSPLYPDDCASGAGKYLAATEPSVAVTLPTTVTVPITVRIADATVNGRLWDVTTGVTVTRVDAQMLGWSQGSWSAARVEPETGVGRMRASSGDNWLVAYHIDPDSGYQELPGVTVAQVPTDATEMTTDLRVWDGLTTLTGVVRTPSGDPVSEPIAVAAVGISPAPKHSLREGLHVGAKPGGDTMVTRDGHFTLTLGYGVYAVSVFGPAEILSEYGWISPEPEIAILTPNNPSQSKDLQYRLGDAQISGQVTMPAQMAGTMASRDVEDRMEKPTLVWAATTGGHTKTWTDLDAGGTYTIPVLQGRRWVIGAAYEVDRQLWITQTVVMVREGTVELSVDLQLASAYSLAEGLAQSIDGYLPSYGELEDGATINIPAGALPENLATLQIRDSVLEALAQADFSNLSAVLGMVEELDLPAPEDLGLGDFVLMSPAYDVTIADLLGQLPDADELLAPMALTIPYDEDALADYGLSESNLQAVAFGSGGVGFEVVDSFLVDEEADEVVVFADGPGSYGLVAVNPSYPQVFLPLIVGGG